MTEIHNNLYQAEKAQDQANDDLEAASSGVDMVKDTVQNVRNEKIKKKHEMDTNVLQTYLVCHVLGHGQTGRHRDKVDESST